MWLKDTQGEKSVTLTVVVTTLGIALSKLLLSGLTINGIHFGVFAGTDFAAVVTPVFALYWGRRQVKIDIGKKNNSDGE